MPRGLLTPKNSYLHAILVLASVEPFITSYRVTGWYTLFTALPANMLTYSIYCSTNDRADRRNFVLTLVSDPQIK